MHELPSIPNKETITEPVKIDFQTGTELEKFVHEFWNAVDSQVGNIVAKKSANHLVGERTCGKDRMVIQESNGTYSIVIYSNSTDNKLSQKAESFLLGRGEI